MKNILSKTALVLIIIFLISCSTVPIIGRKQLNLLPESQMVSLSLTNYKAFLDSSEVVKTGDALNMIKKSGAKIAASVTKFMTDNGLQDRLSTFAWEYNLVKNKEMNAWCMPGGKVVFYEGIIPLCKDETGIAVVMGHEIAHAVARHGNERMSQGLVAQLGNMALDLAIQKEPEKTRNIFLNAYGIGTSVGIMLPYSRKHEYEADKLGLIFMTMAGYDPNEAIRFWERMAKVGGSSMPEFLSTHPISENRIAKLKEALPEMQKYKSK